MSKHVDWSDLPDDSYGRVLDFLTAKDLGFVSTVSRKFHRLAIDRRRWESLYFRDFSLVRQPRSGPRHVLPVSSSLPLLLAATGFKTAYVNALKARSVKLRRNATLRGQLKRLQVADWRGNRLRIALDACYGIIFPISAVVCTFLTAVLLVLYADGRLAPSATGFTPFIPFFVGLAIAVVALCTGFIQDQRCSENENDPASAFYMQHSGNESTVIGVITHHMGDNINVERCPRVRQLYVLAQMLCAGLTPLFLALRAGNIGAFANIPYALALLPMWICAALLFCLPFGCGACFRWSRTPHKVTFMIFLMVFLLPFLASVVTLLVRVDGRVNIPILYVVIPIMCTAILVCLTSTAGMSVCCLRLVRRRRQDPEEATCSVVIGIISALCISSEVMIAGHFDGWFTRGLGAAAAPLLLLLGLITLVSSVGVPIPLCNSRNRRENIVKVFAGLYSSQGYTRPEIAAQKRLLTDAVDLV